MDGRSPSLKTNEHMNNLTLQQKIVYPILASFILVGIFCSWYFVSTQTRNDEHWYQKELYAVSLASGYMTHQDASEMMRTKGFRFHRLLVSKTSNLSGKDDIESKAARTYANNPRLESITVESEAGDSLYLAVFTPVVVRSECLSCHDGTHNDISFANIEENSLALFGTSGTLTQIYTQQTKSRIIVFAVALGIVLGLGWLIHRLMNRILLEPMRELKNQTEVVANCDLRQITTPALERKLHSNDEMGHVTRSFLTMIQMFRSTLHQLQDSVHEVTRASAQINSSMEKMAAGTQEQINQSTEVAASIEEMTLTIIENSKNAVEATRTAQNARMAAEAGGTIVIATAGGMERIAKATGRSEEMAIAFEQSSKKIGEITKLIDDIANQSSLLALNAATEAARAGEKGKGFAIVADEVRKLAERTMKATREIEDMIKRIQRDAGETVKSMNEGTAEVTKGKKLVEQAGQSLQEIVASSQTVTTMISQIAVASKEQSRTSEQIATNVEIINSVTRQTAEGTRDIAIATEGLNRLTAKLQHMVNEFKLDNET